MPDLLPVVYRNPFTGEIEMMPAEMVKAYNYNFTGSILNLEDAARVAAIRDNDEATNFLLSMQDCAVLSMPMSEGSNADLLTIQPPSLR